MDLSERVKDHFSHSIQTSILIADSLADAIAHAGQMLVSTIVNGKKVLTCGNGGTAALANYFSTQLIHRFLMERPALPAISLASNSTVLSAIANDQAYKSIFAQQISALGQAEDVLLCITTSGNAENIIEAIKIAHEKNMHIISLTGKDGGKLRHMYQPSDVEIRIPSDKTTCIHEGQLIVINCLCDTLDRGLFGV
ncbi:D-sedoheptulose-7-phosphate isomerase [Fastidiosibacter lacustris]|uniref:D-sedoheptulose-7-phosphate isomerase n=1 Tax=Fastidiosibacter lacustris TaxID=2056695 RepID=UPI000E356388|nr:SIS domain-containing protein [Fastidiosibacter lacustris]